MLRYALTPLIVAACAAGCAPGYRVHVNTYAELAEPLSKTAAIHVATDPNSRNPILQRQIESKTEELLRVYGYNPVAAPEKADYTLTFRVGTDSQRVLDYTPMYRPFGGFYGGYYGGWRYGYTTYVPYLETVYTHWLEMKLYRRGAQAETEPVWIGEALVGRGDPELRQAVNYLLVACLEYLGADTREWVTVRIRRDDPRLLGMAGQE